jgi:uncharacterized protein involved in type VI secretion and phage assembly
MPVCGKHRGEVLDNIDPLSLARLQVSVPDVPGADGQWAMPSLPYAGPQVGFVAVPPVGAHVWVEFEAGDPNFPIWTGCFWAPGELPSAAASPEEKVFKTDSILLQWSDAPGSGGFRIEVGPPAVSSQVTLRIEDGKIEIDNGEGAQIVLDGGAVTVNQGALEVK